MSANLELEEQVNHPSNQASVRTKLARHLDQTPCGKLMVTFMPMKSRFRQSKR